MVPQHSPSNLECTMEPMGSQALKAVLILIESGVAIRNSCSIGHRLHRLGVIDFGLGVYATSINTPATDKKYNSLHAQPSCVMTKHPSIPQTHRVVEKWVWENQVHTLTFFYFCPNSCLRSVILSLLLFVTVQARIHSRAFKCSSSH